ncbi:MAG: hypothetical protein ACE5IJ_03910 [Thermoplasmata archaeon]
MGKSEKANIRPLLGIAGAIATLTLVLASMGLAEQALKRTIDLSLILVPGYFIGRSLLPKEFSSLTKLALSFALGLAVVPQVLFALSVLANVAINQTTVVATAGAVSLTAFLGGKIHKTMLGTSQPKRRG